VDIRVLVETFAKDVQLHLAISAAAASYLPARRALAGDPMEARKAE
jgi:hypothetical protein